MIDQDILDVAAVVTGEKHLALTGWQLEHAIAAMTALGHSRRHISSALLTNERAVAKAAAHIGVALHRHDQRPDEHAIQLVLAGQPMPLTGVDRAEAIRRLAPRGLSSYQIAELLRVNANNVRQVSQRIGVTIGQPQRHTTTGCGHIWPDELTPDASCLSCGLAYADWSQEEAA